FEASEAAEADPSYATAKGGASTEQDDPNDSSGSSGPTGSASSAPALVQPASALTSDRQSGQRLVASLAIARAMITRSGPGSIERSGSPKRCPIMTAASGPTNGNRPPRS